MSNPVIIGGEGVRPAWEHFKGVLVQEERYGPA